MAIKPGANIFTPTHTESDQQIQDHGGLGKEGFALKVLFEKLWLCLVLSRVQDKPKPSISWHSIGGTMSWMVAESWGRYLAKLTIVGGLLFSQTYHRRSGFLTCLRQQSLKEKR